MSTDADGYRRTEHYASFFAGRTQTVRVQALAEIDGRRAGRDFSASKWQFRFRAWTPPAVATGQTFLLNVEMTKVTGTSAAGDTGKAQVDVTFTAAQVGDIECEVVVIDTTVSASGTPSGKAEYLLGAPWEAHVYLAPGAT